MDKDKNSLTIWTLLLIFLLAVKETIASTPAEEAYMVRENSAVKPFLTQMSLPHFDWSGSTMITNSFVRLTADVQGQQGSLWNQHPIMFHNWEVEISFQIHGRSKELCGDGFVFWYTKDRLEAGSMFGSKEYFSGLAVILDTYNNNNGAAQTHHFPYIYGMVNNGSLRYNHDVDGEDTRLQGGCEAKFRNLNFDTKIKVKYYQDTLTVLVDIENKRTWKPCFTVEDVKLPTGYYLGVSAATGDLSDNHDIIWIKTYDLGGSQPGASYLNVIPSAKTTLNQDKSRNSSKQGVSNVKIFFFILLALIVIGVLIVGGKYFYEKYQRESIKRLY